MTELNRQWVPTHKPERWQRPDGSFDVLAYCRWLDDLTNGAIVAGGSRG